jgi:hypothetical protein
MDIKGVLQGFAKIGLPLLGAALPVPGGVAIGTALAGLIGAGDGATPVKPEDILAKLTQDAEALEKAKEFEETHQEKLLSIAADQEGRLYESEVADRKSARDMQIATHSRVPAILTGFLTLSFVGVIALRATHVFLPGSDEVLNQMIGQLGTLTAAAVAYWLGTTRSSANKDITLATQVAK